MSEIFLVVRNDEHQYSIWPRHRPVPAGWHPTGVAGPQADCLGHIARVWSDMRPFSARRPATGPVRLVHDTARLQLREVLPAELACRHTDGHRHTAWAPGYRPTVARDDRRGPAPVLYEIVLTATGSVIGELTAGPAAPGTHELRYALEPRSRGHGYATEAVDALATRLMAHPGARRVTITVGQTDAEGAGVAIRAGFGLAARHAGMWVFHRSRDAVCPR